MNTKVAHGSVIYNGSPRSLGFGGFMVIAFIQTRLTSECWAQGLGQAKRLSLLILGEGTGVAPASAWAVPLLQCRPAWTYLIVGGTELPRSLPKEGIHQNGKKRQTDPSLLRHQTSGVRGEG